jgi:hypothetical protein
VRQPIEQQRLKPRITEHDFHPRPGRRIAGERGINLVAQVSEKHRDHYMLPLGLRLSARMRGAVAGSKAIVQLPDLRDQVYGGSEAEAGPASLYQNEQASPCAGALYPSSKVGIKPGSICLT